MVKKVFSCLLVLIISTQAIVFTNDDENKWLRPLGPPPKAKPRRISGGESFPPLPLPATPLRRTERKREPSGPKLIGKVVWGEASTFKFTSGLSAQVSDWNMCPGDIKSLLGNAGRYLGTSYNTENIPLTTFHGDPVKTPVLFFSGGRTIRISDEHSKVLRAYVLNGGLLVLDSIAGSPYFYKSARTLTSKVAPGYQIRTLPLDHPLYKMLYKIKEIKVVGESERKTPFLEAVYIGSRLGVLISRYGLGCGWDGRGIELIKEAKYYERVSACEIGVNIIAYAVGYGNVGREEAKPEIFGAIDEKHPTDEFVFAQIKHSGSWNTHPGAVSALLRRLRVASGLKVSLKRVPVSLGKDKISSYSFMYLTGLDDFSFSSKEISTLRHFIQTGGTLLINNALGMSAFDKAVRRELKKVLPEAKLQNVPTSHQLYTAAVPVNAVSYTPLVVAENPGLNKPALEGIQLEGDLRIIYSKYDLAAGWDGIERPMSKGYESHSAVALGMNVAIYAATH
ncbi:MAG: DUF4159 domain-containing protein [Planctomycetota bacterium]|jgi:hypothetical protein